MATIVERNGSYRITVSAGFDSKGNRIRHTKTWKPDKGMTKPQIKKALNKAATDFENLIENGYTADNKLTFAEYAEKVITQPTSKGKRKPKTIDRYHELLERINPAIGHIKLIDLRTIHLDTFYANLSESNIRKDGGSATAKIDIPAWIKQNKSSRAKIAEKAKVSASTVGIAARGEKISESKAQSIAEAMGKSLEDVFTVEKNTDPLSDKTILEHHRLISLVLKTAKRKKIVPNNVAEDADAPKIGKKDPNYFQPATVADILGSLESEPLKWRLITHLLIVTGCRRGEIMGLKWEKVDFESGLVKIDTELIYTKSRGVYEDSTKTSDVRFLNLPRETMDLLQQHKREQLRMQLANGDRWQHTGYVFTQDNGDRMNPDSITGWLSDFAKRHGLPHINPHAFRHTAASVLLSNGLDVVTVSKQLGHASVVTTEKFYSHIIEENKAKAAECIADVLLRKKA